MAGSTLVPAVYAKLGTTKGTSMPRIADALTIARVPLGLALALVATIPDDPSRVATTAPFVTREWAHRYPTEHVFKLRKR